MVNVKISRHNTRIKVVEIKGHAGYAKYGKDIVCSAISAIASTALLGLIRVSSQSVEYTRDDKVGYLRFLVPLGNTEEEIIKQEAILETMLLGLMDLEQGYQSFINLKEEVI